MGKQIVVVGLGRFGVSLAMQLHEMGHDVLALDIEATKVQEALSRVTHAVHVDATNEDALRQLGLSNFDIGIVAIGTNIQSSILATLLLKRLGIPYVVARAQTELHGSILEKIGADQVLSPEQEMGVRAAYRLYSPQILDYVVLEANFGVSKVLAPPHLVGRTLVDLEPAFKGKPQGRVLALLRGKELILIPDRYEKIAEGDILLVIAREEALAIFRPPTSKPAPRR